MIKKYFKILFYISLVFCFLQNFVIFIVPGTNAYIPVGLLFWVPLYICCLFNYKKFLRLLKINVYKHFLIFIGFVIITSIIHFVMLRYIASASTYFLRWYKLFIALFLVYLIPFTSIFCKIPQKIVIKIFIICFYVIFILGIINYIGILFNINPIIYIFKILSNCTFGKRGDVLAIGLLKELRVQSIFYEPSSLGQFIFIVMPIIFKISTSKYKIVNNNFINYIIKYSFIPLMYLNLIFTKSPIYLALCLIETFVLLIILNIKHIKRKLPTILFTALFIVLIGLLICCNFEIDFEQVYIGRILKVINNLSSFENLVNAEPSLATRLVAYIQQMRVFLHNPMFGCGQYNLEADLNSYFLSFKLPMTPENYVGYYNRPDLAGVNRSLIWSLLAETGIVGTILYFIFVYLNVKYLTKIKKYFYGIEKDFLTGLYFSIITITIISFYNLVLEAYVVWLLYGLNLLYIYKINFYSCVKRKGFV